MSSRGSRDPRTVCISSERSSPSKPRPRGCHVRARVHRVSNPKSCPFPAQISNLNYSGSQIPNLKPPAPTQTETRIHMLLWFEFT